MTSIRSKVSFPAAALLAIALAVPATASFAQAASAERAQKMQGELKKRFEAADANGDGQLTKEEAKKMPMVYKHFDEIDTAKKGSVTMADIAAFAKAQHDAKKSAP
jgi:Ca2+-binding EF-hand superfamily protein